MSGITLSSSVRQNLLSLQSTADLLSTTQSRLSTGNKVNSALDNPTNFFTAQGLNNRSSDINNLLDGIGNGVQILQAANTGITSLQKLVDSAKSIANQALQTTTGYSTKSNVSTTIAGATADDLRGTTTFTNATATGNVLYDGTAAGTTAISTSTKLGGAQATLNGTSISNNGTGSPALSAGTLLYDAASATGAISTKAATQFTDGATLTVNGKTITFSATAVPGAASLATGSSLSSTNTVTDSSGNSTVYMGAGATTSTATLGDVLTAIDVASGAQTITAINATTKVATLTGTGSSVTSGTAPAGNLSLKTGTGSSLSISGKADFLNALGLTSSVGSGIATATASASTAAGSLGSLIQAGSTLNVDGKTITFSSKSSTDVNAVATGTGKPSGAHFTTDGSGNSTVFLGDATVSDLLSAIDLATGTSTAAITGAVAAVTTTGTASTVATSGALKLSTGAAKDLVISGTGNALAALGLNGSTGTDNSFSASRAASTGGVNGKTLSFTSFNAGTAVDVTFGDGTNGTVKSLAQLNAKLSANNMGATVDANGLLTIAASNDYASTTIGSTTAGGTIGGTLTSSLTFTAPADPVKDAAAQTTRANLVSQFNNIMDQINTTSQDSSFNGVNLLGGDTLKLTFNETGKSTLNIQGVSFNSAGLGLSNLVGGTDFIDNASTNKVLSTLTSASTSLRSQASALGSNLTIVQLRQDFSKNLINVLQTGASNLTLADTNEEAANSQALSTRQSIAVSALSLANQSQQGVLQLLR
ncbi:flagellin [Nitrobacteraceae bacterium AZCC 2161]